MRLFNLLKRVCYKLGLIDDFVVERGQTGVWTWRKWYSGDAECWGTSSKQISFTVPSGVTLMGYASITVSLPDGLFVEVKQVIPTQKDTSGIQYTLYGTPYGITTTSFKNNVMRLFNTDSMTAVFSYRVIGTWK